MPTPPTNDLIQFQALYPPGKTQTNTDGILMALSPGKGSVRTMDKPLIGIGDMLHFLGPDSKIFVAKVRVEKSTFSTLETADDSMMALDGCLGTVTITPRSNANAARASRTLTNCKFTVSDATVPVSSGDLYSREYTIEIKQMKVYGP